MLNTDHLTCVNDESEQLLYVHIQRMAKPVSTGFIYVF